ncbi:hypothetical protein RhiirA1_401172 [Rhizophagus irregularis]|uniref:Uncharacterized protein n=1 Tax=Rhizophagus irregularis TaxID=588596 RepID=A0A2I1FES4_9GLOM|nr:hypothetical protein RhiirA1_401172 [Rhizophagus irregularis]PKY32883.1 hypothetical protein RhiirB3_394362 [Rhizophagus irregularis]
MNNNVIHDMQQGQVRTIMIYDIPTACSHDHILNLLKEWGQVLEISFKTQHKFQSVWTKMILKPTHDTDFVMRTWSKKLGDVWVRWFPGHWKLKDRKICEKFQCKITLLDMGSEEGKAQWTSYHKNYNFEQYMAKLKLNPVRKLWIRAKLMGSFTLNHKNTSYVVWRHRIFGKSPNPIRSLDLRDSLLKTKRKTRLQAKGKLWVFHLSFRLVHVENHIMTKGLKIHVLCLPNY